MGNSRIVFISALFLSAFILIEAGDRFVKIDTNTPSGITWAAGAGDAVYVLTADNDGKEWVHRLDTPPGKPRGRSKLHD